METPFKKQLFLIPIFIALGVSIFLILQNSGQEENASSTMFRKPMDNYSEREKLLTYGMFVTPNPEQNPIDPPERFVGYHTALDVEIFEHEKDKEVEVNAICDGIVVEARTADGYGGVFIHSCQVNGEDVTVLYGHLNPDTFTKQVGEAVKAGEKIATLGAENSDESGFTRKHLHLGVHKGKEIKLRGYVQTEAELQQYINPADLLK